MGWGGGFHAGGRGGGGGGLQVHTGDKKLVQGVDLQEVRQVANCFQVSMGLGLNCGLGLKG